jgi:5'-nucleotidase/UDP-sugar diphosphatase
MGAEREADVRAVLARRGAPVRLPEHPLAIAHVNDTGEAAPDAWARMAGAVAGLRAGDRCDVLLHAGDVDLSTPTGASGAALLSRLRVDGVALGNHDLDGGVEALRAQAGLLRGRLLCANVTGAPAGLLRPYRLLRRRGWRVAVVGLTLRDFAAHQPARNLGGLAFPDPAAALARLWPRLRAAADLVVVLSHCGVEVDRAIAAGLDAPALVIGGHSHVLLDAPEPIGRAWVAQAGCAASHVGWVEVRGGTAGLDVRGGVIATADAPPDPAAARLAALAPRPDDDEVVAHAETDLRAADDYRETPFANLVVDLLRERAGTDLALLRCAAVRNDAPAGPLTRAELRRLNPNGADRVARLSLTGAELRELLECGAQERYYLLTVSGGRVAYDLDRPAGRRVTALAVGGAPVDPTRRYTVACSEYLAGGISVFAPLRGKPFETLPVSAQELLDARVAADGTLRPAIDGRLTVRGGQ